MIVEVLEERFLDDKEIVWTFLPIQDKRPTATMQDDVDLCGFSIACGVTWSPTAMQMKYEILCAHSQIAPKPA